MSASNILCPHCQKEISLDHALSHQLEQKYKKDFETKLQQEKIDMWKVAQEKALEKIQGQQNLETKLIKEELVEKQKQLEAAQQSELEIRKMKNKIEEEKRNFELEKQRQLDAEREKIKNDVVKILSEEHQFKDAEKDKKMSDMLKTIDELKRRAQQGSQQLQGEVLELELEEMLSREFPFDEIIPVAKGVSGADILQKIFDRSGKLCGIITWESKRTKAWSDSWISKLKDDQRNAKAEIAVLISNVLPNGITRFGPKDGIYVCNFESVIGVAQLLRNSLLQLSTVKLSQTGKEEKKDVLWNYLTSTEFKHRMESIFEAFLLMKSDLEKEKHIYTKMWAKREKQIQRLLDNTSGMRGELEGLMGNELPEMKELDLATEPEQEEFL